MTSVTLTGKVVFSERSIPSAFVVDNVLISFFNHNDDEKDGNMDYLDFLKNSSMHPMKSVQEITGRLTPMGRSFPTGEGGTVAGGDTNEKTAIIDSAGTGATLMATTLVVSIVVSIVVEIIMVVAVFFIFARRKRQETTDCFQSKQKCSDSYPVKSLQEYPDKSIPDKPLEPLPIDPPIEPLPKVKPINPITQPSTKCHERHLVRMSSRRSKNSTNLDVDEDPYPFDELITAQEAFENWWNVQLRDLEEQRNELEQEEKLKKSVEFGIKKRKKKKKYTQKRVARSRGRIRKTCTHSKACIGNIEIESAALVRHVL